MVPTQDAKKVKPKDTKKKRIRQDHKSVSLCSLRYLLALLQSFQTSLDAHLHSDLINA
jgi:hypothetical protein